MGIITKFLAKRYSQNLMITLSVICLVIFATDFLKDISGELSATSALDSAFANFLEIFPLFLPITAFIATLLTFYKLTISSELVIMQSAGLSTYKIIRPMLIVSAIFGVISSALINPLSTKYNSEELHKSKIEKIDKAVFLREKTDNGTILIRASDIQTNNDGALAFLNTTLVRQNEKHQIIERISADKMILMDRELSAQNASILDFKGTEKQSDIRISTSLNQDNIIKQYLKPNQVSIWELPSFIEHLKNTGAQPNMHILQFFTLIFLPFVLVAMTTLGVLFSKTNQRRNFSFAGQFGLGILVCFLIYFMIQTFNAIGASGAISPFFAVFFPPAIILFFAATAIAKRESV